MLALCLAPAAALAERVDSETGLLIGAHWEVVRDHCTECHSAKLITAQRGSRQTWTAVIRWMQDTQGLRKFDSETEAQILDYLSSYYGPKEGARRTPIPPFLMPPNPFGD